MKRLAAPALLAACLVAAPARADLLCMVEAQAPAEVHDFESGAVIGALPPGMQVVVTDRTFLDALNRPWVFAVSLEGVAGWIADDFIRCR